MSQVGALFKTTYFLFLFFTYFLFNLLTQKPICSWWELFGMYPLNTKFLVVDDHPSMRIFVKEILREMGYFNIIEATDGQKALTVLKENAQTENPVDFIISDWSMPQLNGFEFLKIVRQTAPFKGLPFMLVTGERDQQLIIDAAKAGVSDYIIKPFSASKIKNKIEKIYLKNLTGFVNHLKKSA